MDYRLGTDLDLSTVLAVLDDAAAWLWSLGIRQWPQRFRANWVTPAVQAGETWLALRDGEPIGTFTLSWRDAAWSDYHDEDAGYLHRLAVRRSAAGIGSQLLDRVDDLVCSMHRHYIRLDCVATNSALRRYYETAGFEQRGDVEVRGAPGQRLHDDDAPSVIVSRYQRSTAAHQTA